MTTTTSSLERLKAAQALFFSNSDLDAESLRRTVARMCRADTDWADVHLQQTIVRSWMLDEGRIKTGSYSIDRGAGLRTVTGESSTLAYTDILTEASLAEAARTVAGATDAIRGHRILPARHHIRPVTPRYGTDDPTDNLLTTNVLALLRETDALAREADPRITNVSVTLQCESDTTLLYRLDGLLAGDVRPMVYLSVTVLAEENGRRERASSGGGSRDGLAFFTPTRLRQWVYDAVGEVLHNLRAEPAPAGVMPVVLGPGWPGILLHEAVGHGLEGDFIRKGTSVFASRLGQRIASPGVTVVDDGTLDGKRGSLTFDDEGTPTQRTTLIEDGILTGFMHDLTSARLLGTSPSGNGRRESFAVLPQPRMTNTFMLNGPYSPEEILRSVKYGIYASNFGGGQVDITNGKFVFAMTKAFLIENGELTRPVRGAMLTGSGPDALRHIPMIGSDLALDPGVGHCGKDGQHVPVGVGLPTLRIDALTVGGTNG